MSNDTRRGAAALVVTAFLLCALPASAQPADTVVVVPFTNVSRQPADDWIGAGLAETIAADLRNAGLNVAPFADAPPDPFSAGNGNGNGGIGNGNGNGRGYGWSSTADLLEAHRRRGVTWLVDGALQRIGERLRITTRVIDVATGTTAFSTRVDGTFAELFDLQDEVGAALAARLSTGARVAGVPAAGVSPSGRVAPSGRYRPGRARPAAGAEQRGGGAAARPRARGYRAAGGEQRHRRARVRRTGRRRSGAGPAASPGPQGRRVHPDAAGTSDGGHRADRQPARDRRPARRFGLGDRHLRQRTSSRSRRWKAPRARRRPRCGWRTTTTISTSPSTPITRGPRQCASTGPTGRRSAATTGCRSCSIRSWTSSAPTSSR